MPSGTRSVSTQQTAVPIDATHFLTVATFPARIFNIEGVAGGTAGTTYYLQLLSTLAPVSGTTEPIWSMPITGGLGFSFVYEPVGLDTEAMTAPTATVSGLTTTGVYVAISSTAAVYTSVANTTNVRVDFEEYELERANETMTGDLTTSIGSLTVWTGTGANVGKRLVKIEATNNNGATQYLMLFASIPANGDYPINNTQWGVAAGGSVVLNFGRGIFINGQTSALVNQFGCVLRVSSTAQTMTSVANGWTIRATYVNLT